MKKFFIIFGILIMFCSCSKKSENISTVEQERVENLSSVTTVSFMETTSTYTTSTNGSEISVTTIQDFKTTTTDIISETTVQSQELQLDPLGDSSFSYDENGAIRFESEPETDNDRLMISVAQALFESACRTQWDFTVGCPYEIDINSTVQNGFGWTYYKIIDKNINSFSDIENDYYKTFSERYPNEDLQMLYLEFDGSVYALNGQREKNIYYSVSRVKSIQSRTDDEIFFVVENLFEGTDKNPDEDYSEETTFSIVISSDNIWKAGQFLLPY